MTITIAWEPVRPGGIIPLGRAAAHKSLYIRYPRTECDVFHVSCTNVMMHRSNNVHAHIHPMLV
jgi:hypothetical protein